MGWLIQPAQAFLTAGLMILVIELGLVGISGPLLFLGLGSLATSGLLYLGIVSGWEGALLSTAICALIFAIILWKPLKKMQSQQAKPDRSSDMIGQAVIVSEEVNINSGKVKHSGIDWNARIDTTETDISSISANQRVEITAVNGNVLVVKPL